MKTFILFLFLSFSVSSFSQNYNIGHRQIVWIDSSRNNRSVKIEVYYPASSTADNVPVITNGKKFPVVVFGHGYQLTYSDYLWLKDSLVPKGFFLAFPRTEEQLFPNHTDFAKDLAFIVNQFDKNKKNSSQWFYNRLNSKYATSGHSMGGGCSLLSVQYSKKINAVFNFAAAETNPSAIAACGTINISSLLFAGGKDCISPPSTNQQPMYNNIQPYCKTYIEVTKAQHCHWANNAGVCTAGQIFCAIASSPKPTLNTSFNLLLPWLNGTLYNNRNEASRFENLLASAAAITYQQQCKLITGVDVDKQTKQLIKLYPSIVNKGVLVNVDVSLIKNKSSLKVTDQNGKVVYTDDKLIGKNITQISTTGFSKGIYFVTITNNGEQLKSSFMVE